MKKYLAEQEKLKQVEDHEGALNDQGVVSGKRRKNNLLKEPTAGMKKLAKIEQQYHNPTFSSGSLSYKSRTTLGNEASKGNLAQN